MTSTGVSIDGYPVSPDFDGDVTIGQMVANFFGACCGKGGTVCACTPQFGCKTSGTPFATVHDLLTNSNPNPNPNPNPKAKPNPNANPDPDPDLALRTTLPREPRSQ